MSETGRDRAAGVRWLSAARVMGLALSIGCCVWVGWALRREIGQGELEVRGSQLILPFAVAVLGAILVNACLGLIWRELVVAQGIALSMRDSIGLSWRVQIAKYIPGNVFHFAGRIALADQLGVSRGVAMRATLLEPIIMLLVAAVISVRWWSSEIGGGWVWPAAGIAAVSIGGWIVRKHWLADKVGWSMSGSGAARTLITVVVLFGFLGLMFSLFLPVVNDAVERPWLTVWAMTTFSWAVGFVAVGAPGGLGVREATLTLFAINPVDRHALMLVGVLTRAAMLVGDAVSLALSALIFPASAKRG